MWRIQSEMSVFNDFQQVWMQRFPDNPLPGAWEEHVRMNLEKHNQKVLMLKEEMRKEEVYVEYLERLLLDIQKHQKNTIENDHKQQKNEAGDVTPDTISNVNIAFVGIFCVSLFLNCNVSRQGRHKPQVLPVFIGNKWLHLTKILTTNLFKWPQVNNI